MEDKIKVLNDLIELSVNRGLHNGRWEDEYNREFSVEEYVRSMKAFADKYDVEYDDNVENYRGEDGIEYDKDEMGFAICSKVQDKMINIILGV